MKFIGKWVAVLALLAMGSSSTVFGQHPLFQIGEAKSLTVFDPRMSSTVLPYSEIEGRVILDGDIDLGTPQDVMRNSWLLIVSAAREAQKAEYQDFLRDFEPQQRDNIAALSRQKLSDLPENREQAEQLVISAINTLKPLLDKRMDNKKPKNQAQSAAIFAGAAEEFRWKDGTIPYTLRRFQDQNLAARRAVIEDAIKHWNQMTTRIQLVLIDPKAPDPADYVEFVPTTARCYAECVGRRPTGGIQRIGLGETCGRPQAIHEIGHIVGLFHEQCRNDRGSFLELHLENVLPGYQTQFAQIQLTGQDVGKFDFESIMLYPYKAFSANGKPTMTAKPQATQLSDHEWGLNTGALGGLSERLSGGDLKGVEWMYPAKTGKPSK